MPLKVDHVDPLNPPRASALIGASARLAFHSACRHNLFRSKSEAVRRHGRPSRVRLGCISSRCGVRCIGNKLIYF